MVVGVLSIDLFFRLFFLQSKTWLRVFPREMTSVMGTPKFVPASLPSDERKSTLSLDEAKTDFVNLVAKLKHTHVSVFFQWLELQINAYRLNGSLIHG